MTTAKKIIKNIIEGGLEFVKDSGKQIGETVSPEKMLDSVLGPKETTDEFTKYLQSLGGELTPEQIEQKKKEFEENKIKEMEEARKVLKGSVPPHMKPSPQPRQPSPYEEVVQEGERKKAILLETQQKQRQQQVFTPAGKQQRGSLFARKKRPKTADFEAGKNIKIG